MKGMGQANCSGTQITLEKTPQANFANIFVPAGVIYSLIDSSKLLGNSDPHPSPASPDFCIKRDSFPFCNLIPLSLPSTGFL